MPASSRPIVMNAVRVRIQEIVFAARVEAA
jgi:hypothetical protein